MRFLEIGTVRPDRFGFWLPSVRLGVNCVLCAGGGGGHVLFSINKFWLGVAVFRVFRFNWVDFDVVGG